MKLPSKDLIALTPNRSVNRTPCRLCRQVPSALRAPVAGYVERWAIK